ncbi:uncharacterized protein NECHADRAFT_86876 [Fusarium vanettenii 77-13-4]|uniref:Rhodopsin domain-containing protein n=1 Tax=Fusarium vanettenii (strain ATCC MYA-4622 / CBS 123669 / FGSC 9596 / NRRL 45880 / 77-13-4) TaxID=660122 RepID=C7ZHV1_FUSV7|nr:uncharacterized protein NECHADRAFT_86876 [Fusarium vanettenii 77-13-4]EEU36346.1 hypothetical protein NECHADRAFT_86876 [Fusarium vanettenii 77-13-4]
MSSEVTTLIGVSSMLLALVTIFVTIRFFVRSFLLRSLDWDDVLVPDGGPVEHSNSQITSLRVVISLAYIWGFVTVKMSFAVLYLRLLPGTVYRRLNQVLLVLLLAQGLEESLVVIFRCNPVDKAWTPAKRGHCLDLRSFYYTSPIPMVWRMQLSRAKKIGVVLMLSLGLFVCVISIVRVTYISVLNTDVTHAIVSSLLWSEVEVSALVLCACIPSFRPFLRCFPRVNKALGLSSGEDSNMRYTRRVSQNRRPVLLTSQSGSHKHSRRATSCYIYNLFWYARSTNYICFSKPSQISRDTRSTLLRRVHATASLICGVAA